MTEDEENIQKIISYLEVFGITLFILVSIIGIGYYIPHLNDEISLQSQDILKFEGELDKMHRLEIVQATLYSSLFDTANAYPTICQGANILNSNQTLFVLEYIENQTLTQFQFIVYIASEYQGNGIPFESIEELDLEQLIQLNSKLNFLNGQKKLEIESSLTEVRTKKIEIEKKRDRWLNIILFFQILTFMLTNLGEIYKHYKIVIK